jgi:hypothetical protein
MATQTLNSQLRNTSDGIHFPEPQMKPEQLVILKAKPAQAEKSMKDLQD